MRARGADRDGAQKSAVYAEGCAALRPRDETVDPDGVEAPLETGLALEQEVLFRLYTTQDAAEGIRAFVEKREAKFEGK